MNFYHSTSLFLALTLSLHLSFAQQAIETLARTACSCLEASPNLPVSQLQTRTDECIQYAMNEHMDLIRAEYQWDDSQSAERLGWMIGESVGDLLLDRCEFVEGKLAASRQADTRQELIPANANYSEWGDVRQTDGWLRGLRGRDLGLLLIEDTQGQEQEFLWLTPFDGEQHLRLNGQEYQGRKVRVFWKEIQVYHPLTNAYRMQRGIVALEAL